MFRFYTIIALITELSLVALLASITNDPRAFVLLAVLAPATVIGAFMLRSFMDDPARRTRSLSPESIAGYRSPEESAGSGERLPREISRSIVERSEEIQRTMSESPSEIQTEMCAIGYRSCVNDMITLTHKINAALPEAGLVGRMRLRADRRRATDSLAKARRSLPPGALRATRQELQ
ncbi:hypothetical protein [Rubrobacter aplysinae]|uniref:hypothetical protein n=1 Tax=Rubrobacter aplysinae TaxID=909625 RepID=UPI00064BE0FD|nr:hypothetical protein [Rubrobacter aplysinae]